MKRFEKIILTMICKMFSESSGSDSGSMPVSKIIEFKVQGSNTLLIVTECKAKQSCENSVVGHFPKRRLVSFKHIYRYYLANQGTL